MQRGAIGIKIKVSGRLGGSDMSRQDQGMDGRVPLHTLKADIDYGTAEARTTLGRIGVKVWVYKGDRILEAPAIIQRRRPGQEGAKSAPPSPAAEQPAAAAEPAKAEVSATEGAATAEPKPEPESEPKTKADPDAST
jgi:small subunit ribosomal protein S3